MKNRSGEKIKLASIDELLGVVNEESAMEIEISKIHPFKNHPFKVLDDEKMQDLVESVKINGVLTPVLLRMDENEEYEMVSGHRRMHAAQLAGLTTIPAIVRELSDDDAIVAMVDANIQREELLPSEKAFAYKRMMFMSVPFIIGIIIDIQYQGIGCWIAWGIWLIMFVLLLIDRHKRER